MTKNEVCNVIKEDEENGYGEILDVTDDYAIYYDYQSDIETTFRFEESCTDEYVKSIIHIGKDAKTRGLKEEFIVNVLKKAFGDDYFDAICTLSGIIIPSTEKEFKQMLNDSIRTSDDVEEWYEWEDNNECVGRMLTCHQIVFINENLIAQKSKELAFSKYEEKKEYEIGILVTLLHEMRHLMLDTNPFLPEDEFTEEMKSEDSVEAFARERYEALDDLKFWR